MIELSILSPKTYRIFSRTFSRILAKVLFQTVFLTLLTLVIIPQTTQAQRFIPKGKDSMASMIIDTAILVIAKKGLSEQDFINQILADTGFYQAFRNLKNFSMLSSENIQTYDKKGLIESHIQRKIQHDNSGSQYHQKMIQDIDSGSVYRHNGKYKLFTLQMFSYIFENEKNSDLADGAAVAKGGDEGYKQKLKRLIFQPGKPIDGIPFISSKTEIFSPDMRKYYNYSYASASYYGNVPVYRFTVSAKPEYREDGAVMIKDLVTIFDKTNFKILGRYINMKYSNLLFSFDVRMNIETRYFGDDQIPVLIQYAGNWDVPFHRKETAAFSVLMSDVRPKGEPSTLSK